MLQNTTFMNISNNIFVDSGNNQVIRRITNNNNNVIKSFSRNSYWYGENYSTDGSIATYESNPIETDPKLTDPGNAVETAKTLLLVEMNSYLPVLETRAGFLEER